jgi:hypothetical protein
LAPKPRVKREGGCSARVLDRGSQAELLWAGIQIRQVVEDLERLWAELVGVYRPLGDEEPEAYEGELRVALSRRRARERWLRDEKIAQVKGANSGRLPCQAFVDSTSVR